jgi:hypothetical protein
VVVVIGVVSVDIGRWGDSSIISSLAKKSNQF